MKPLDLTNQKFNRLTAIRHVPNPERKSRYWLFICECGTTKIIKGTHVTSGLIQSCGCRRREISSEITHGMTNTPTFKSWNAMRGRCLNPKDAAYQSYGGRGIDIHPAWDKFENFLATMGVRPAGSSLDRIDNNKGYGPDNCRWATSLQQVRNRRTTNLVEFNGEKKPLQEWAESFGLQYITVWHRFKKGDRGNRLFRPVRA